MIKLFINYKIIPIKIGMILFLFNSLHGFSQGFNHTFLLGYNILLDTYTTATKARLNFDANNVTVVPETRLMPFRATQGNISDANGNLLIASNGCWIANANNDTMMNGCCLNPGLFTNDWCDNTSGIPFSHANIILPYPGDSSKFVLFHQTGNYNISASSELYYTVIDMTQDGGLGGVDSNQKNVIIIQDTFSLGISACKHANGRDWWIVALKDSSNIIYKVLLTPSGISSVTTQALNIPLSNFGNAGQPTFSPDGEKFAYTSGMTGPNAFHDVRLFHFDRCTGDFSDTTYYRFAETAVGFGISFSSNSKYLYACSMPRIFQLNTDTNNIIGTVDTVATWDGFYSPIPPYGTYFWFMYLAANGKIYVTTGGTVDISYINLPDLPDAACDVQQHALHLPCYSARASVNHPNYYLGPVLNSVCDSLGLSVQEINHDFHFNMYPNPVTEQLLKIIYLLPQNKEGAFEIFDINGRKVYSLRLPQWSSLQMINLPELSDGLYQCVITSGNSRISKKVSIIKN
jgi:type IX secretion system substrate protein/WD40 repeat protein